VRHRDAGVRRELFRRREMNGKITLPNHLRHDRRSPCGSHQTGHARGEEDCGAIVSRGESGAPVRPRRASLTDAARENRRGSQQRQVIYRRLATAPRRRRPTGESNSSSPDTHRARVEGSGTARTYCATGSGEIESGS
jgi:hypothetical protein